MKIGEINELKVEKEVRMGFFLSNDLGMEVLLPTRYVPAGLKEGDTIKVFVYRDSEERPIATTETPLAMVNQLAFLKVKGLAPMGAFLDLGLPKDVLVPLKEQSTAMSIGESYLVFVYLDDLTQRLVASSRLERFMSDDLAELGAKDEVDVLIWKEHERGFKVIVNEKHVGIVYQDQLFKTLHPGDKMKGYINQIRPDGKIDVLLQKPGYEAVRDARAVILAALKEQDGYLPVTDQSSPDEIVHYFSMSKKIFKKTIGALYKSRIIDIEDRGIRLK